MTRAGLVLATICTAAASGAEIHWSELAKVVKGKTLVVATKKGETYEGRFVSSLPDSIVLKDTQEVKIERDSIKSIYRKGREARFSHIKNLGLFVLMGYILPFSGFESDPQPLMALFTIPLVTVGGAVGAPISFIRDLFELAEPPGEFIVVLPDPTPGVTQ
jgi:hypothetical protein